ncbi:SDR family NAD(P)-dependent oxidoreductase [Streptomyces sp. NPDC127068]|uniref:SDR family NAD(P)-dependent oxidoreductase n=1 Tax=Streptomyces sp. NPDC127068 TaxID=3347127 RepID=UPI003666CBC6
MARDIAILGMGCRFPGDVCGPEEFWEMLAAGGHVSMPLPRDRGWDIERLCAADPTAPGATPVRRGGFVSGVDGFDADFFGIGPLEATAMDPQQRWVLECAWRALEHARIPPGSLRETATGVYVGAFGTGYGQQSLMADSDHLATGLALSVVSGRVAHVLGLRGPAVTVDTACSSSLTAAHLAVQALRAGECEVALAAGVTVMAGPETLVQFGRVGAMSVDGVSRSFSTDAKGFGAAEGVGVLVLMPLERAVVENRRVLAVIRGSALNQDGASEGLAVPNGTAQQAVMRAALADAGLRPGQVQLIEAHGTGTRVGDPIEAGSVLAVYGADRGDRGPVRMGSVKSNIGHAQGAAGMAGLIKVVLSLQKQWMPATLHVGEALPGTDGDEAGVRLLRQARPWHRGREPRRAGVLGYGVSGTNAHLVVEEAPAPASVGLGTGTDRPQSAALMWPLYGATATGLKAQAAALGSWLRERERELSEDVGWSLATTRTPLAHRAVVAGADRCELLAGLAGLAAGAEGGSVVTGRAVGGPGPVFVFPGQGGQWAGMGRRLMEESPVFAETFAECAAALAPWVDFDVTAVAMGDCAPSDPERAAVVQPVLFAMYVALARLWQAHGVRPAAVIGHSQGEVAAACVAGALSLEEAARVVARRAAVLQEVRGRGAMASLGLPAERALQVLAPWDGRVEVAADNGPAACVVAGDADVVREVVDRCGERGVRARLLPVDYASHSRHLDTVRDRLLGELGAVASAVPGVPMFSTTSGGTVAAGELDGAYWFRNVREPVAFAPAVQEAIGSGYRHFVEVSPHPMLTGPLRDMLADAAVEGSADRTIHRDDAGLTAFRRSLSEAHVHGAGLAWDRVIPAAGVIDLPTYRFEHRSFWLTPSADSAGIHQTGLRPGGHRMVRAVTDLADGSLLAVGRTSLATLPWLADHAVHGTVLLPASAMLDLLAHLADRVGRTRLSNIVLCAPLVLSETPVDIQLHCSPPDRDGHRHVVLASRGHGRDGSWTRNAEATLADPSEQNDAAPHKPNPAHEWPPPGAAEVDVAAAYRELDRIGYCYGPGFRNLRRAWKDGNTTYTEVDLPPGHTSDGFLTHPALLDAALHAQHHGLADDRTLLPYAITSFQIHARGARALHATVTATDPRTVRVEATDASGRPVLTISGLRSQHTTDRHLRSLLAVADSVAHQHGWQPLTAPRQPAAPTAADATPVWGAVTTADDLPVRHTLRDIARAEELVTTGAGKLDRLILDCRTESTSLPSGTQVHQRLGRLLGDLQAFLASEALTDTRLLLLTRQAQSTEFGESVRDPGAAACAALAHSASREHPGRIQILDTGDQTPTSRTLALMDDSPHTWHAQRADFVLVPELVSASGGEALTLPADGGPWRLTPSPQRALEDVRPVVALDLEQPVAADRIRVRVTATGVNFRDTLVCLGVLDLGIIGFEAAGVITDVGGDVTGWSPGERVVGLSDTAERGCYASAADFLPHRLVRVPPGLRLTHAAGLPIVSATARAALVDLAQVRAGEKVLIHAAAGGVGSVAVHMAQRLGAEVYATASPSKHGLVHSAGIPRERIADSRSLDFEPLLRTATGGTGFDVIIGSLAGKFVNASLRLLRPKGRYIELGMTDRRDSADVAANHPGIVYHRWHALDQSTFDLADHFVPPTQSWSVRYARQALRRLSQGRTTGKTVLTQPIALDPHHTTLITGGTGTLGAAFARHLVTRHRVRHLLLLSRRGESAPNAHVLRHELEGLGATVTITACDTADREQLAHALSTIPPDHPLGAVIHAAGTLDDALLANQTPLHLRNVLRPKVDAVLNLHELTADTDLSAFVICSSMAGVLGNPGQANYAAANAFVDAFAHWRRHQGLPCISVAWGLWEESSELTETVTTPSTARMVRDGLLPLTTRQALSAFDTALDLDQPFLAAFGIAPTAEHPMLAGIVRSRPAPLRTASAHDVRSERDHLLSLTQPQRLRALTRLVQVHAAAVLGHTGPEHIDPDRAFRSAGFDSLAAVELRTLLSRATGTRLTATALLDHSTPAALARHLTTLLPAADRQPSATTAPVLSQPNPTAALREAWNADSYPERLRRVQQITGVRRATTTAAELRTEPLRRLNDTASGPPVVCVPPLTTAPEHSPYALLAQHTNRSHTLWTTSLPGLRDSDDLLPSDLSTLTRAWVTQLVALTDTGAFVLLGHSAAGLLAHALAHTLQQHGKPAAALILLDPLLSSGIDLGIIDDATSRLALSDTPLTPEPIAAVVSYAQLLIDWTPPPIDTPTLLLHPRGSTPDWPHPHTARAVAGDHFSLLEQYADKTAEAFRTWLAALPSS